MDENPNQITAQPEINLVDQPSQKPVSFFRRHWIWLTSTGIIVMLIMGGGVVYVATQVKPQTLTSHTTATPTPTKAATTSASPQAVASIKKLDDLGLVEGFGMSDPSANQELVTYWQAGTIPSGPYQGYTRIVAIDSGGLSSAVYQFATKDGKYILNGNPDDISKYPSDNYQSPYYNIVKTKITTIAKLPDNIPTTIKLSDQFSLKMSSVLTGLRDSGKKDADGKPYSNYGLITDLSKYTLLSTIGATKIYYQSNDSTSSKYLDGTETYALVDKQGLVYQFNLILTQNTANADNGTFWLKKDIDTTASIYGQYGTAFPQACGFGSGIKTIKNVTDSDFTEVGNSHGVIVYKLANSSHELNQLEYQKKVTDTGSQYWNDVNPVEPYPTFDQYMTKTPLLFFKDYWNHWAVVGEYDYHLLGGCGKPVVYLYPAKPTDVTVKFLSPIQFTTTIPTYQNQWHVQAQPNGQLTDLQPQVTNCALIDDKKPGSEYAKTACLAKTYPYLYWAGNSFAAYPTTSQGWVINQADLKTFLTSKLSYIGLHQTEINDMLEYWLPQLQAKNAQYYKLSFLQNQQLNQLFPMSILPKPDTAIRVFLDWAPLQTKPRSALTPQTLTQYHRQGFTMVEWGGLKR